MPKNQDRDQKKAKLPAAPSQPTEEVPLPNPPDIPLSSAQLEEIERTILHGVVEAMNEVTVEQTVTRQFMGPLPPPEVLKAYNEALPDGANRIVTAFEKQGDHRRQTETRGQKYALWIALSAIVAAVVCALQGQPLVGGTIVLSALVGIGLTGAIRLFLRRRANGSN